MLIVVVAVILGTSCGPSTSQQEPRDGESPAELPHGDPRVLLNELQSSGIKICNEILLPVPNRSYKFEDSRHLTITVPEGKCFTAISDMEAEPSHGFIDVERFDSVANRDAGLDVHRSEVVRGTDKGDYNPARRLWSFGNYLVVLGDSTTEDVEMLVVDAMRRVEGAQSEYKSPRALKE